MTISEPIEDDLRAPFAPGLATRPLTPAEGPQRRSGSAPRGNQVSKRSVDLVFSVVGLLLLSPVMLAVAALVKLSSPGPVIFSQRRLGKDGRFFQCFKFRTMTADAEQLLDRMLLENTLYGHEFREKAKLCTDPRLTRYGRFLRRSSLDELPQLFNVILGDMSLVGPRPLVPPELIRYGSAAGSLLTVKPGITGLWQVSGRNKLSYHERIEIDMRYIAGHNLLWDLWIMARTVVQIFRPSANGAY